MLADVTQTVGRTWIRWRDRELLFFGGGDYHGLTMDPAMANVAEQAIRSYGLRSAGARSTTGNHPLFDRVERAAADFLGCEAVALCSGGYLANFCCLRTLADEHDSLFIDAGAHVSLREAARLVELPRHEYRHFDPQDLARMLAQHGPRRPLVLSDGVGGMLGDIAPLPELLAITQDHDGTILLDEAHAFGVLGAHGRGSLEHWGLDGTHVYRTGSLAKAFGAGGGLIPGDAAFQRRIQAAPGYLGASAPSLPILAVAEAALQRLTADPTPIRLLQDRAEALKTRLRAGGLPVAVNRLPVIALPLEDPDRAATLERTLLDRDIYPSRVRYPGLPAGGIGKFIIRSSNTDAEIETLASALLDAWAHGGHG